MLGSETCILKLLEICFLFFKMTNKCISQNFTLLHASTLSCRPQGACNQSPVKLRKYFKCSCW